ncbi:hypothetical protein glysoja_011468 [Glycine soja]|nr:hypothetical protein glysoja_011468 [Glycine soja]
MLASNEETVCLHCGDRGFPETLVFCTECMAYALHRYCLKGLVNFTDAVTWFCEDCATKLGVPPALDQSTPIASVTRENCIQGVKKHNKQRKKKITKKQIEGKANAGLVAKTKGVLSASHSSSEPEHPHCSNRGEEEHEVKNDCGPVPRDVANFDVGEEESVARDLANSDVSFKSVPVSQGATNSDSGCVEVDGHVYAQPTIDPIWRGSMYFCNGTIRTVSGLLAHISNLACSQVAEETGHFPEVLHAEFLPRDKVWAESFKRGDPTDQDIALFFFPDSEGSEKDFDVLVEDIMICKHVIRFVGKNAELLIFPSTELPVQNWRYEAKYYLWGVFRKKANLRRDK